MHLGKPSSKIFPVGNKSKTLFLTSTAAVYIKHLNVKGTE